MIAYAAQNFAVICAYLDGDLARIRTSFIIGSLVPLFTLLVWDAVTLGLSAHADLVIDPVELLTRYLSDKTCPHFHISVSSNNGCKFLATG